MDLDLRNAVESSIAEGQAGVEGPPKDINQQSNKYFERDPNAVISKAPPALPKLKKSKPNGPPAKTSA